VTLDPNVELPFVSVIIPFLDEEAYLPGCLESVLAQSYPLERLEIVTIDGGSADGSRRVVEEFCRHDPRIRLLVNPRRYAAAGLNVGLREARGEIVLRVDAHAVIAPDYVEKSVRLLQERPELGDAGGPLRPIGETAIGQAIALALRSPFSMGGSPFRYATRPRPVDTVYLGAYRRCDLDRVGQFDEALGANEDYELNYRRRSAGWLIWCDPAIHSQTYTRRRLGELAWQYLRYGFWKARVAWLHPRSVRPRHLVAPLFVLALGAGVAAAVLGIWQPLAALAASYAGVNLYASWRSVRRSAVVTTEVVTIPPRNWLPLVFAVMHLCWGIGFLAGIVPALLARKR